MPRRRHIGERERARIFLAHDGICHICGQKIDAGRERYQIDHIIPLEMGGEDGGDNLAPAHEACHTRKTAQQDVPNIRKAQRQERRSMGIAKQSRNPLPGSKKSRLKRKLDGTVVDRETGRPV